MTTNFNVSNREEYVSNIIRRYLIDKPTFASVYTIDDEIVTDFEIMGETQSIRFNLTSEDNNVQVYINDDYENEAYLTYDDDAFERGDEYMTTALTEQINEILKDTTSDFIIEKF